MLGTSRHGAEVLAATKGQECVQTKDPAAAEPGGAKVDFKETMLRLCLTKLLHVVHDSSETRKLQRYRNGQAQTFGQR